jgi:hypothetical protein
MGAYEYAGSEGEEEGEPSPGPACGCELLKRSARQSLADLFVGLLAVLAALGSSRFLGREP